MPELVERNEISASELLSSDGNCFAIAGFWIFLQLQYDGASRGILHCIRQPAQALNCFFKQLGHANQYIISRFHRTPRSSDSLGVAN